MIKLFVDGKHLLLSYTSDRDPRWVTLKFDQREPIVIRKTFHLQVDNVHSSVSGNGQDAPEGDDTYVFAIGELSDEYFKMNSRIVGTDNTFYFHESMVFSPRLFVTERDISILPKIDKLVSEDVYVGGSREDAMPASAYAELMDKFPNSYELTKYASARVGACLRDYFESASDTERIYQQYMNRKVESTGSSIIATVRQNELAKYQTLLAKLEAMLANEFSYSERQWQDEIIDIIRLLYPKYIQAFENVHIKDSMGKNRYIDILIVDSCGNIDLIEIKKPFDNCIVSKRPYRGNHIPMKELSGAIMQVEKYILYLNKLGQQGEKKLSQCFVGKLPEGLRLKIINPRGIIIMGRENTLTSSQKDDFEIIKRKYKSVIDIVTYDDLLARLRFTILQLQSA